MLKGEVRIMVAITKMNTVEDFIKSLSLPHNVARGVLSTEEDCQCFKEKYYGKNRNVIDDLLDYREDKIGASDITVDAFMENCYTKGLKVAFQETFLQLFASSEIKLVETAMMNGKTSLVDLFTNFQKNPNKNIMRYVL